MTTSQIYRLIDSTINTHKNYCNRFGFTSEKYQQALELKENIGGESEEDSISHLFARYLNSASRTQYIVLPPNNSLDNINQHIIKHFFSGKLCIIDIAAGHGAGTISLINSMISRRKSMIMQPDLSIEINAFDTSHHSLNHYEEIIKIDADHHLDNGIETTIKKHVLDLTNDEAVSAAISSIKASAPNRKTLIICSAISGLTQRVLEDKYSKTFSQIVSNYKEITSTFLWVEPRRSWLMDFWEKFKKKGLDKATQNVATVEIGGKYNICDIKWLDPINSKEIPLSINYCLVSLNG